MSLNEDDNNKKIIRLDPQTQVALNLVDIKKQLDNLWYQFQELLEDNPIKQFLCSHCNVWQVSKNNIYEINKVHKKYCDACRDKDIKELTEIVPDISNYIEGPCSDCKKPFLHKKPETEEKFICLSCKAVHYQTEQRLGVTSGLLYKS